MRTVGDGGATDGDYLFTRPCTGPGPDDFEGKEWESETRTKSKERVSQGDHPSLFGRGGNPKATWP